MVGYAQARADHEYLWAIGPADDMTGGYVDQCDLDRLLKKPTKDTAADCYSNQIVYWFQVGPDGSSIPWSDPRVAEIADRYGVSQP